MRLRWILVSGAILLAGCASQAHLYPANEAAVPGGVLVAHFTKYGTSHGPISVTLPNGAVLKGEYSIVSGGATGFGSIYGLVYGAGGTAHGSAFSSGYSVSNSGEGTASLFGNGEYMNCEFLNNNLDDHGHGACKTNTGAVYRLIY